MASWLVRIGNVTFEAHGYISKRDPGDREQPGEGGGPVIESITLPNRSENLIEMLDADVVVRITRDVARQAAWDNAA